MSGGLPVFEAIALAPPVDAAHDRGGRPEGGGTCRDDRLLFSSSSSSW
jgi:hypothetical protein